MQRRAILVLPANGEFVPHLEVAERKTASSISVEFVRTFPKVLFSRSVEIETIKSRFRVHWLGSDVFWSQRSTKCVTTIVSILVSVGCMIA